MTDLVERLRDAALWAYADGTAPYGKLFDEAAAEIERLRADAARWQWLRQQGGWPDSEAAVMGYTPEDFDKLADAAMKDAP